MSYGYAQQNSALYTNSFKKFLALCHEMDDQATWFAQDHRRYAKTTPKLMREMLSEMKQLLSEELAEPFTSKALALEQSEEVS